MKPVRGISLLMFFIALPLGIGMLIGGWALAHYDVFELWLNPLTPQGIVWFGIALVCLIQFFRRKKRLEMLKNAGTRYEAEQVEIRWSGRADCVYTNERGERCIVRSRVLVVTNIGLVSSNFAATIYVDKQDPSNYEVEVFRKGIGEGQFDKDYR